MYTPRLNFGTLQWTPRIDPTTIEVLMYYTFAALQDEVVFARIYRPGTFSLANSNVGTFRGHFSHISSTLGSRTSTINRGTSLFHYSTYHTNERYPCVSQFRDCDSFRDPVMDRGLLLYGVTILEITINNRLLRHFDPRVAISCEALGISESSYIYIIRFF